MSAPEFDPKKPFKVVETNNYPEFDPEKPFKVEDSNSFASVDFSPDKPFDIKKSVPPSVLESILRGVAQGATLGFSDEIAGGVKSVFGPKSYKEYRDDERIANANARAENPYSFIGSEFTGGVITPIAAARALKALGVLGTAGSELANSSKVAEFVKRAVAGGTQAGVNNYGQQTGNFDPRETAASIGAGAAMSFSPEVLEGLAKISSYPIKGVMHLAGTAAQWPSRAMEYISEKVGKNVPMEMIDKVSYRETGSKKTKELGQMLRRKLLSDKDDILSKMSFNPTHMSYEDLNADQKSELAGVLQKLLLNRGKDAYNVPKEEVLKQLEAQLNVSGNLGKTPVVDLLQARVRMTPKTAYEYAATANRTVPIDKINTEPALTSREAIIKTLQDYELGKINHNFEDVSKYGEGMKKAGFGNLLMDLENKYHAPPTPKDQVVIREIEENYSKARESLKNINIGRDRIKNDILPIMGVGSTVMGISDTLGTAGQFAGRISKKITPEAAADSFAANPSLLQYVASRGGKMGIIAKDVLDSTQAMGMTGQKTKSFVMSMHPKFRYLFSDDKANQDQRNQEPIQR